MKKYTFPTCFFYDFYIFPTLSWDFLTLFQLYIITTNRPCEAVGVEEINGLVQNAKGLVYEMPKGSWSETLQKHNRINDWIANL